MGSLSWPDLRLRRTALVVPLGSCEQHGPHLPFDTDTRLAVAVAERVAAESADLVVAPAVAYGASGEHAGFPGTLSIGAEALELLVVELVRSADHFDGVVLVNGHGGNSEPVERAVRRLRDEGRSVLAWWPAVAGGDAHAGRTETSLLLAIEPGSVRLDRAEAGATAPLEELWSALRTGGVAAVAPNGVLGDPTTASAGEGEQILRGLVRDCADTVAAWRAGREGRGDGGE